MIGHAEYKPDGNHIYHKGCTSVAYKGQGNTRNGHKSDTHSHILKSMEQHHGAYAHADLSAKGVIRLSRRFKALIYKQKQHKNKRHRAYKSQLLAYNGKYKVR